MLSRAPSRSAFHHGRGPPARRTKPRPQQVRRMFREVRRTDHLAWLAACPSPDHARGVLGISLALGRIEMRGSGAPARRWASTRDADNGPARRRPCATAALLGGGPTDGPVVRPLSPALPRRPCRARPRGGRCAGAAARTPRPDRFVPARRDLSAQPTAASAGNGARSGGRFPASAGAPDCAARIASSSALSVYGLGRNSKWPRSPRCRRNTSSA